MTIPPKVSSWNVPNALTMLRVFMVPFFAHFLYNGYENSTQRWIALCIFLLAMFTDQLDGHIARSRNLITNFGKIADPIADKALIGTALVVLSMLGTLWWWVTVLILLREIGITVMRFTVLRYGVIPASSAGKWKTIVQAVAIGSMTLPIDRYWHPWIWLSYVLMGFALVLTLTSGASYLRHGLALRKAHLSS